MKRKGPGWTPGPPVDPQNVGTLRGTALGRLFFNEEILVFVKRHPLFGRSLEWQPVMLP